MPIYFTIIIPIIFSLYVWKNYKHYVRWYHYAIFFVVQFLIAGTCYYFGIRQNLYSKEYWGSVVTSVQYYEDWNERIHKICTSTGPKGTTRTYDCSYTEYHPEEYYAHTSSNEKLQLTRQQYLTISKKFRNNKFHDLHRKYYTIDGNMYESIWNKSDSCAIVPITTVHTYKNKIKASGSNNIFYKNVSDDDAKKYGLFDYPEVINYSQHVIVGGYHIPSLANELFERNNGLLGPKKQVKVFVLLFKNKPIDVSFLQEAYWAGGNKNEFIITIGINDSGYVKWSRVFSWTPSEKLKIDIQRYIDNQGKLDLISLASYSYNELDKHYVRRQFEEFDYINVDIPILLIAVMYFFMILLSVAIVTFIRDFVFLLKNY